MELKWSVETSTDKETGDLQQIVYLQHEDHREMISNVVTRTRDAATRAALIELGWTPPGGL